MRQTQHLAEQVVDDEHKEGAHGESHGAQPPLVLNFGIAEHAGPTETEEEAGHRLHRNKTQSVDVEAGVATAEVCIGVETKKQEGDLDEEDNGGYNGRTPIQIVGGRLEKEIPIGAGHGG